VKSEVVMRDRGWRWGGIVCRVVCGWTEVIEGFAGALRFVEEIRTGAQVHSIAAEMPRLEGAWGAGSEVVIDFWWSEEAEL
jgi:hypothetical protein